MAFSCGVLWVVRWESPHVCGAERETAKDVFFLSDEECPGLEVSPPFTKLMPESSW